MKYMREWFLTQLMQFSNLPYIWGAQGPDAYDCSGLAQVILALINLDPPGDQNAQGLHDLLEPQSSKIAAGNCDLGDVIFFGKAGIDHVAIALNKFQMIEARGGDHTTISKALAEARGAKVMVTQIAHRSDLVACLRPQGLPWSSGSDAGATSPPTSVV